MVIKKSFLFTGQTSDLITLILKNTLFTILSLGIYIPFARTENRKFLWNNTLFFGRPFHYLGTGQELLRGFIILALIFIFVLAVLPALLGQSESIHFANILVTMMIFFLAPYFIYRSRIYLMGRTTYRSIHFAVNPKGQPLFVKAFFLGWFLTIITFGMYYPYLQNNMDKIRWNHTKFGDKYFNWRASNIGITSIYVKGTVLTLATLGLYLFWLRAEILRYKVQNLFYGKYSFDIDIDGVDLIKIYIVNLFGGLLTLGLATPWLIIYNNSYYLNRMTYTGDITFEEIEQIHQTEISGFADSAANYFDMDIGF